MIILLKTMGTLGELNKKAHDFCNDIICEASTRNEVMRRRVENISLWEV